MNPINTLDALMLVGAIGLIAAGWLLARGWRGRLVRWSPSCARCSFDLRHSAATTCAECGADLTRHGAVLEGHRSHRPWLFACSAATAWCAVVCIVGARIDGPRLAWEWWLTNRPIWAMEGALRNQDAAAWAQVDLREQDGLLSEADLRRVLVIATELPSSIGATVSPSWGWLVTQFLAGRVSDDAMKIAIDRELHTAPMSLGFAPAGVRAGGMIELRALSERMFPGLDVDDVRVSRVEAKIGDEWHELAAEQRVVDRQSLMLALPQRTATGFAVPSTVGKYELRASITLSVRKPSDSPFRRGAPLVEASRVVPLGVVTVFDANTRFAVPAHDEEFEARVRPILSKSLIRTAMPSMNQGVSALTQSSGSSGLSPNEAFDFDVFAEQDGQRTRLGRAASIGGSLSISTSGFPRIDDSRPWMLLCVPNVARAEARLTEPTRVYDGEISLPRGPIDAPQESTP